MTDLIERLGRSLAGRYTIERELGQGGMATVFLANDIKHERQVALKVLKPELAAVLGADRFVVEIKTTASLSHPHILPLFDSGTADGFLFYVMPFIQGETLRDKLNRETQFGVDEAVRIACEVADALDYAHRHGVIHRDIKPENILLHDGRPMVADFGIALALSAAAGGRMTETGLSLGTPHYMSPEQATAEKEITGRSDVYSLASVLYEMLSGEPPHMGKSAQQIIMKIIAEPVKPVTELRKSVPQHVADAVAQALEKLPADRFASAAEFAGALQGRVAGRTTTRAIAVSARSSQWKKIAIGAAAAAVLLAGLSAWALSRTQKQPMIRLSVAFPEGERLRGGSTRLVDISRDGKRIVYVGPDSVGSQLWVRELSALSARPLPGTRDAIAPFFSPDGESVGYISGVGTELLVVSVNGGQPRAIVRDSVLAWGADWGDDGNIYFVHTGGQVARVRATGGTFEKVSQLDSTVSEIEHDWPMLLPGGKKLLVQGWRTSLADTWITVINLETGKSTALFNSAYARYVSSGHLVYASAGGSLAAVAFDPVKGVVTGEPIALAEGIQVDGTSGAGNFALSSTGILLYVPGGGDFADQVVWVDRAGGIVPVDSAWRGSFGSLALSPDGTRLAVTRVSSEGSHIWVKQLPRGPLTRLTLEGTHYRAAWHPDNRRLAFIRQGAPRNAIRLQRFDGSAPAETVLEYSRAVDEVQVTPDGRTFVFRAGSGSAGSRDIHAFTPGVDSAPRAIATGAFDEYAANISRDGRWVAYVSVESGRPEVYVRLLSDPGAGRTQVSVDGGEEPLWARNGRELYYRTRRGEMMAASVELSPTFRVRERQRLFTLPRLATDQLNRAYDVSLDDRRFVMTNRAVSANMELVVVLNWTEMLNGRMNP